MNKLGSGVLADLTITHMQMIADAIEQNNSQASGQAFRDLTQKCWPDVKDFSNALKVLSQFKQKY